MPTIFHGYAETVESLTASSASSPRVGLNGDSACGHGLNHFLMLNDRSRLVSPTDRAHDVPDRERSQEVFLSFHR
jgi:hypothetical protein